MGYGLEDNRGIMGAIKSELCRLFHFVERFDEFSVVISANEIREICKRFVESILFRFFHRGILLLRNKRSIKIVAVTIAEVNLNHTKWKHRYPINFHVGSH